MVKQITSSCNFILGASNKKSLPAESAPEIAFVGRSNVGKSSLVNLLINSKKAARVSSKPGCTRQINFYSMYNDRFRVVDLPGYGYSRTSREKAIEYLNLIQFYLLYRRNLKCVFVLIDSKVGLKEIDKDFVFWLKYNSINFDIVLTKIDKVGQKSLYAVLESTKELANNGHVSIHQISIYFKYKITKVRDEFFKFKR